MKLSVVILSIVLIQYASSLNILGIFPYQGKSHFFVFRALLRELANRGHNLTVISHFPEAEPPSNYHDVSLAGTIKIVEDDIPFKRSYASVLHISLFLATAGTENCRVMLNSKNVQNLIKQKPKFDVIIVEQFNSDCSLGLAYKLNAPVVGLTSHVLMPYHYKRLGVPYNAAFVPLHFLEGGTKPTLFQRVERVLIDFYFRTLYTYYTQRNDQNTLAEHFDNIPPLEELASEMKILLVYHNYVVMGSRLFPANVIEVGGFHVAEAKPLTGDLKKFMDEAEHGVIYISFGSVVKSSTMPADKVQAILGAIKELPQRIVWKWQDQSVMLDKNKVYISNWLPQVDILAHPKTLAFVTHAGNLGISEAVHYGIPMVAMPVTGDQPSNAAAVEESGLGIQLQIRDLNKENFLNTLKRVLDPAFRLQAKEVQRAWHDRPLSAMDTAVYWTEFAARHPNITLRTAAADVPFYQYNNLDVLGVFGVIIAFIVILLRSIVKLCCSSKRKPEVKAAGSKKKSKRA